MLTDQEIQNLIIFPKEIKERIPAREYKEENNQRRCDLKLGTTMENGKSFSIFIRQNLVYIENFSIGLRYKTGEKALGSITLIRYNGPHGETSKGSTNHYYYSHIHRITAAEIESGSIEPQESHREITDKYKTFEGALKIFLDDVGVTNHAQYFSVLGQELLPF